MRLDIPRQRFRFKKGDLVFSGGSVKQLLKVVKGFYHDNAEYIRCRKEDGEEAMFWIESLEFAAFDELDRLLDNKQVRYFR